MSIVGRLQADAKDEETWRRFVHRYGPYITTIARGVLRDRNEILDVTQEIYLKLVGVFERGKLQDVAAFPAYLKRVIVTTTTDAVERRRQALKTIGHHSDAGPHVERLPDPHAEQALNRAMAQEIIDLVLEPARDCFGAKSEAWQAFELHVLQKETSEEVAAKLGLSAPHVRKLAQRVREHLRSRLEAVTTRPPMGG
jgi:RNA polymerase sigma factor (sigma-70 family)